MKIAHRKRNSNETEQVLITILYLFLHFRSVLFFTFFSAYVTLSFSTNAWVDQILRMMLTQSTGAMVRSLGWLSNNYVLCIV